MPGPSVIGTLRRPNTNMCVFVSACTHVSDYRRCCCFLCPVMTRYIGCMNSRSSQVTSKWTRRSSARSFAPMDMEPRNQPDPQFLLPRKISALGRALEQSRSSETQVTCPVCLAFPQDRVTDETSPLFMSSSHITRRLSLAGAVIESFGKSLQSSSNCWLFR